MHAATYDGCANTVRESALKAADSLISMYAFASFSFLLVCLFVCLFRFVSSWLFSHFDIDVCICRTCAFLIVKRILILIMYSAASL